MKISSAEAAHSLLVAQTEHMTEKIEDDGRILMTVRVATGVQILA